MFTVNNNDILFLVFLVLTFNWYTFAALCQNL